MLYLKELSPLNAIPRQRIDGREIELALHARVSERETVNFVQARIKQLATSCLHFGVKYETCSRFNSNNNKKSNNNNNYYYCC